MQRERQHEPLAGTPIWYRSNMEIATPQLHRFAWISIVAALITIVLKFAAWWVTDSVGLLSDALESFVNLVGAIAALVALWYASREPDQEHAYGHAKAEYFSSGLEGALILLAAISIIYTSIRRLIDPSEVESAGLGVAIAAAAAVVNLIASKWIQRAGEHHNSIALEADARHLMTDVLTTAGVIIGIALIQVTGWSRLDPIIALIVAVNIIKVGVDLMKRSMLGLLDTALPPEDVDRIESVLDQYRQKDHIQAHALRTRQAGQRRFGSVHILVPGDWTVHRGHQLAEQIEREIQDAVPGIMMVTHLESLDDPRSWDDTELPQPGHS
jgi:cation diffusion facilitator family transporter